MSSTPEGIRASVDAEVEMATSDGLGAAPVAAPEPTEES